LFSGTGAQKGIALLVPCRVPTGPPRALAPTYGSLPGTYRELQGPGRGGGPLGGPKMGWKSVSRYIFLKNGRVSCYILQKNWN